MKTVLVLLILGCIFATPNALPEKILNKYLQRGVSDGMIQKLEKLRDLIYNGNETLGIPVLDPFTRAEADINLDNSLLQVKLSAKQITLTGLGLFDVSNIDIVMIPSTGVRFSGSFPLTTLHIQKYSLLGKIFGTLPIYGNGIAHFEVVDLSFSGAAKVAVGLSGVSLKDLQLDLKLGKLKSSTTGMLGGGDIDDLINVMIEDMAADVFNSHSDAVANLISGVALTSLNKVLDGMSLADLINLITG